LRTVPGQIDDVAYLLERAHQMHRLAASIDDPVAKEAMEKTAADYELMAQRAKDRAKGQDGG
jgi:hypothetical protein